MKINDRTTLTPPPAPAPERERPKPPPKTDRVQTLDPPKPRDVGQNLDIKG